MKLILNADDLGFSPIVNQTIFELYNLGRLTSASLVANMPTSQLALDEIKDHPNLSVGIHLNLTKAKPLLPAAYIPSLVRRNGNFYPAALFFPLALAGRISQTDAESECRAQIEFALEAGLQPSHLDTHNHWHMLPRFNQLIQKLAQEYKIPNIRLTSLRRSLLPSRIWLITAIDRDVQLRQLISPHYLLALDDWMCISGKPCPLLYRKTLQKLLNHPDVTLELVLHPGRAYDPEFPPDTISPKRRQWDFDFVCSPEFDSWLETLHGEIIQSRNIL